MTVAPHPISQSRSLSLPAARRTRTAMSTSLGRASSRVYSRSGRASERSNKLAIVLPIDAIFAPPLQDRPRRSVRDPQIPIGRAL